MTLGLQISIGIVVEHCDAVFDVIVHRIELAVCWVKLDAGDVSNFGLWPRDLPRWRRYVAGLTSGASLISHNSLAVFITQDHAVRFQLKSDPIECRAWLATE